MGRLRFQMTISLDGYVAGPNQSLENPMGEGALALHEWAFATRTFQRMFGNPEGGTQGIDDGRAAAVFENVGATVMGRNMFGPVRGPWTEPKWDGWWGDEPPFHTPVFVLTHHPRSPLVMRGGTVFRFVTGGVEEAVERAHAAAGGKDVTVGGGASTVQQCLRAGLVDAFELHLVPRVLGAGERLFDGIEPGALGFACVEAIVGEAAVHLRYERSGA